METNRSPDIYVITAVNMGDRPSDTIATVALRKTTIKGEKEHPKAAEVVINSCYVDDIVDSVGTIEKAYKLTNDICSLLEPGTFQIKDWSISSQSQSTIHLCNQETHKVLGISWHPQILQFNPNSNFSKFLKNRMVKPGLLQNDLPSKFPKSLSKRVVLSQLNSIYDPLGLLTPSGAQKFDWDTPLPNDEYNRWIRFFEETSHLSSVHFPRSVKPNNVSRESPLLMDLSTPALSLGEVTLLP